jgi:hypothetical protein
LDHGSAASLQEPARGAEHYLIDCPAGLRADRHRYSAAHAFTVLEATLEANGQQIAPEPYCHFPAGTVMHDAPAKARACFLLGTQCSTGAQMGHRVDHQPRHAALRKPRNHVWRQQERLAASTVQEVCTMPKLSASRM